MLKNTEGGGGVDYNALPTKTNPKFMRSTCFDMPTGMVIRDRKVQWSSVDWGQEQGRGQGRQSAGGRAISTASAKKMRAAGRFILKGAFATGC